MKIIEFAGLPGCGKTTLCNQYIDYLSKFGHVFKYTDIIKILGFGPLKPMIKFFEFVLPTSGSFSGMLSEFSGIYEGNSEYPCLVIKTLYNYCLLIQKLFPNSYIVLEEGFVQTLTSVPHLSDLKDDCIFNSVIEMIQSKLEIFVVDCRCDSQIAAIRLRQRDTMDRFNMIKDDKELLAAYETKQKNLNIVLKKFDKKIEINMNNNMDKVYNDFIIGISNYYG